MYYTSVKGVILVLRSCKLLHPAVQKMDNAIHRIVYYLLIANQFSSPGLLDGSIMVIVRVIVPCTLSAGVLLPSVFVNSSGL